ncbi:LysR substrate-binding domain-containing protein [Erwiniaceae bacterium L1_54_3]|uniref:LysR substrate-binding domain-containing protein n=1 Tax=Candidatus Pantoea formicae TaxID=2608355 RepID=UPI001F036E09|nr:LysR substrate-binding domain-containing protein [Pantoea formicae]MDF7647700.1 LysR substrate-binding domain-containing protein [Erwiniaceae bacterium L1_54_3]
MLFLTFVYQLNGPTLRRVLPGISALIAFEASARHNSFSRAASELHISEGAVSRQISRLESQLGTTLFLRRGNRVELSRQGVNYASQVRDILGRLEQESLRLIAQPEDGGTLELAVMPTFASRWLIPRLGRFQRRHPNIILNLSERTQPFPMAGSGFDVVVHFDHPAWAGHQTQSLFEEMLVPVCRPGLIEEYASGVSPLVLLHKRNTPNEWRNFVSSSELNILNAVAGPRFDLFSMLIEAAVAGMGVALVPSAYVKSELASGSLCIPWTHAVRGNRVNVVTLADEVADPAREVFVQWLLEEVQLYCDAEHLPSNRDVSMQS